MTASLNYYLKWYQQYMLTMWDNMTPMQYGYLLVFIALCGYALMKSATR